MYKKHKSLIVLQVILSATVVVLLNSYLQSRPDLQDRILLVEPDESNPDGAVENEMLVNDLAYEENIRRAYDFLESHDYRNALAYFRFANQQQPSNKEPFLGVAESFLELDQLDPAKNNINNAAKLGDFDTDDNNLLVKFYILNRQLDEAASVYTGISDKNIESYYLGALINLMQPNLNNAKEKLNLIITQVSNSEFSSFSDRTYLDSSAVLLADIEIYETFVDTPRAYLLTLVGQSLVDLEEYSLARRFFFEAIRDKGDYRDAWLYLGYSYILSDNLVEAEKTLQKAKELDPYNPVTYFYLGLVQFGLEDYDLSIRSLEQASGFGYEPNYQLQEYLGHNYYKLARFDQAINSYRQVVSQNNVGMDTMVRYSWLMIEYQNDTAEATTNGNRAIALYPDEGMSYNLLGWAYLADRNFDLALQQFELALERDEELPAVYLNIGVIYKQQGRIDLARENFEQAERLARLTSNDSIFERAKSELSILNSEQ